VSVKVDLTGVSTSFEPLPQGYYQAVVESCAQVLSKEKKTPMIQWIFSVTEPEEFVGRKQYYNTMLVKNSLWVLKRLLIAIGLGTEESLDGEIEFEEEDCIGLPCTLVIVPDEYEGKTTSKIDEILEAGEVEE